MPSSGANPYADLHCQQTRPADGGWPGSRGTGHSGRLDLDAARWFLPTATSSAVPVCRLQRRRRNSHKGQHGSAGVLGGARGMQERRSLPAVPHCISARVVPTSVPSTRRRPPVTRYQPRPMMRGAEAAAHHPLEALACGPRPRHSPEAKRLLERACTLNLPLLLDADAHSTFSRSKAISILRSPRARADALLTPPGEAARLLDASVADVQADRIAAASELADHFNAHVALRAAALSSSPGRQLVGQHHRQSRNGQRRHGRRPLRHRRRAARQGWPAAEALTASVHLHGQPPTRARKQRAP